MVEVTERDEFQVASLLNGFPTCIFAAKNYRRVIKNIEVTNSIASAVSCYRGVLGGSSPVTQNIQGSNNTFSGTIILPAGQPFFVQWALRGANVKDATARISWENDTSPQISAADSASGGWTGYAIANIEPAVTESVDVLGELPAGTTIAPFGNPTIYAGDVRSYQSFYLKIIARVSPGNGYNCPRINMQWFAADPQGLNTLQVLREDFEWWAQTGSPAAGQEPVISGEMFYQDRMHGSRLNCNISNNFPTTLVLDQCVLYGTTRQLVQSYQQMSPFDDTLYENGNLVMGVASVYTIPLPMVYGRIGIHRENIGGGANTLFYIRWGSSSAPYCYHNMASNGVDGNPQYFELIAPRRPALIELQNNGLGTTNRLYITTKRERI